MKTTLPRQPALALACALLLVLVAFTAGVAAAQESPGHVATTWTVWSKPGHTAEFEEAIKAHAAWRKQAGDPMHWSIYSPVSGDDFDHLVIRSGDHHWADFDTEEAWALKAGAEKAFYDQVGAHVAKVSHSFGEDDLEHSHWKEDASYRYFGVNSMRFSPGASGDFYDALKSVTAAAKAGEWPRSWAIVRQIGGGDDIVVVWPYRSYADMQRIEPGFDAVLAKHLGSEEEAKDVFKRLGSAIESSNYTIYVHRPDLSTPE